MSTTTKENIMSECKLKPINNQVIKFTVKSIAPMVQHAWSEKAKEQIRLKKAGKKTKDREPVDPMSECEEATYTSKDGLYCIPLKGFKSAIISAAHKDLGIEKTLVKKSFFIPGVDFERRAENGPVILIECEPPVMREDYVRVGMSGTDLRYRPQFDAWTAEITAEFDADNLTPSDILTLVDRAGYGVGIGEMRPEKGGDLGRFQVDRSKDIEITK